MDRRNFLATCAGMVGVAAVAPAMPSLPELSPVPGLKLYPAQIAFLNSTAHFKGFMGGRRSGKTTVGVLHLLARARPDQIYLVTAPTYPWLKQIMDVFLSLGNILGRITRFNRSDMRATLDNSAEVMFRSADHITRCACGPNLDGIWYDDANFQDDSVFRATAPCTGGPLDGWVAATFTPSAGKHWTRWLFGEPFIGDTKVFTAKMSDNPGVNPEHAELFGKMYLQQSAADYEREFCGRFA